MKFISYFILLSLFYDECNKQFGSSAKVLTFIQEVTSSEVV
jgi:hypothetical protein